MNIIKLFINQSLRHMIVEDMKYPATFRKALIVISPPAETRPEFVASVLGKYDKNVEIRDRWMASNSRSIKKYWCGAVAFFSCAVKAKRAAKELRILSRTIKTIMFPQFIEVFIDTEVQNYSRRNRLNTRVIVKGRRSLTTAHVHHLSSYLEIFGKIKNIEFTEHSADYGIICKVDYEFATHAWAACTILNGQCYNKLGYLTAELKQEKEVKELMHYAMGILEDYLSDEDPSPFPNCCEDCDILCAERTIKSVFNI